MTGLAAAPSECPFTLSAASRLFEVILKHGRLATMCGLTVVEMCDHRYLLAELSLIANRVAPSPPGLCRSLAKAM